MLLHVFELLLETLNPAADDSPVGLELGLAWTPQADAAADTGEVGPHPRESGKQIFQLRQLDLELGLVAPGASREDVEDHFGAVHHPDIHLPLQVGALDRAQLLVEDDDRGPGVGDGSGDLLDLPLSDQRGGIGCGDLLGHASDDFGPGRIHEPGQLFQVLGDVPRVGGPLAGCGDEHRALDRIADLDRCFADRVPFPVGVCRGGLLRTSHPCEYIALGG